MQSTDANASRKRPSYHESFDAVRMHALFDKADRQR